MRPSVFAMVLAGGAGKRLMPLTLDRAKPAVPFGGHYRLIDFCLSNLVNGGMRRIAVLTQYKSHSLDRHLATTWRMSPLLGNYVAAVPAQMRQGPRWFAGSADAIFQNLNLIYDEDPDHICVFGADHVYRMDPRQMIDAHVASGAAVTVAGIRVPVAEAGKFGIIEPAGDGPRIARFIEKPQDLQTASDEVFASMGNYVFSTDALVEAVTIDAADGSSKHDIGSNIIPALVEQGVANVYDFASNRVPGAKDGRRPYWRDVGTLDTYHEAHLDLVSEDPAFDLSNIQWPILTWNEPFAPAKFVTVEGFEGRAVDSLICSGVRIRGGSVRRSVVSPGVQVGPRAVVEESVLFSGVHVGRDAVVRRAIIDKNVRIPDGSRIGVDAEFDRARFTVSDGGVTVVAKGEKVE